MIVSWVESSSIENWSQSTILWVIKSNIVPGTICCFWNHLTACNGKFFNINIWEAAEISKGYLKTSLHKNLNYRIYVICYWVNWSFKTSVFKWLQTLLLWLKLGTWGNESCTLMKRLFCYFFLFWQQRDKNKGWWFCVLLWHH